MSSNKAKHAILGAMIGDSLGSTVEFFTGKNAKLLLEKNSYFENGLIGGGPFHLVPGQFTDDTEMALAIMYVIHNYGKYDQDATAEMYHKWYLSNPFDMGNATRNAVQHNTAQKMIMMANALNATSLSNGFLMRLYGLVALYHDKPYEDFVRAVRNDVRLTHGHLEAQQIALVYAMILKKAIDGFSANDVYEKCREIAKISPLVTSLYNAVDNCADQFVYDGKTYYFQDIDNKMIGFVGYAFWLLLHCLKNHTSYKDAILEVAGCAGDSDTNCVVVGAVMGALYPDTIPRKWIDQVSNFNAPERFKNYAIANPAIWKKWLP